MLTIGMQPAHNDYVGRQIKHYGAAFVCGHGDDRDDLVVLLSRKVEPVLNKRRHQLIPPCSQQPGYCHSNIIDSAAA